MDPAEWQAHEDAYSLREAAALVRSGACDIHGRRLALHELLPPHLAAEHRPPPLTEAECFARLQALFPPASSP